MNAKSEQALVGLFVIVAAGVLIGTVFTISGAFGRSGEDVPRVLSVRRRPRAGCDGEVFGRARRRGGWTS